MRFVSIALGIVITSLAAVQADAAKPEMCDGKCAQCNYRVCDKGESCYAKNIQKAARCGKSDGYNKCRDKDGKCIESREGVGGKHCSACEKYDCPIGAFCVVELNKSKKWIPKCRIINGKKEDFKKSSKFIDSDLPLYLDRTKICEAGASWCTMCIGVKCPAGEKCYVGYENMIPTCRKSHIKLGYERCRDKSGICAKCPKCSNYGVNFKCYKDKKGRSVSCQPDYYVRSKKCNGGKDSKSERKKWKQEYKDAKLVKKASWNNYKAAKFRYPKYEERRKVAWSKYKKAKKEAYAKYKKEKAKAKKEYLKIKQKALGKYSDIEERHKNDDNKVAKAKSEYNKIRKKAKKAYNKKRDAEKIIYKGIKKSERGEYEVFKKRNSQNNKKFLNVVKRSYKDAKAKYLRAKKAYNFSRGRIK